VKNELPVGSYLLVEEVENVGTERCLGCFFCDPKANVMKGEKRCLKKIKWICQSYERSDVKNVIFVLKSEKKLLDFVKAFQELDAEFPGTRNS
jgi:hypothetical protein